VWLERSRPPEAPSSDEPASSRIVVEAGGDVARSLRLAAQARGEAPEAVAADLLRRGLEQERRRLEAEAALAALTPRQQEVTRLVLQGQTNQQIARALWLSPETVKTHLRRTFDRFAVRSKAELRLRLADLDADLPDQGDRMPDPQRTPTQS
jgi:RNA polymerase sigma factor (sigma-70 family)